MGRWGSLRSWWIGQSLCSKTGVIMCQTHVEMAKVSPYKLKDRALFRSWHLIGANLSWWTHLKWLVIHMGLLLTRRFSSLATPLFWSKKGRTSNKRWTLKSLISRLIRNQGTRLTGLGMTLWLTMMRSISCTRLTAPNGAKGQAHLRSGSRAPRVGATTLCRRWRCSWIKMGGTRFLNLRWKLQLAQLSRRRTGSNCRL